MTTQVIYVPLNGGLNLIDSPITTAPGALIECINFEQVFGQQGYSRISGYERYDGQPEPHMASYWVLSYDGGTAAISVGDTLTGASATAKVLAVEGTNASGRLILGNLTGQFVDNEALKVSGVTKAYANGVAILGSISEANDSTYHTLAVESRRSSIQKVPGEGAVLGCAVYQNTVIAVRNAVGGQSATMWKSSASGWQSVKTGLYPGGKYRFTQNNFTGDSTQIYLFGCDGKNRPFRYTGTTYTAMSPIFSTQATSTTSIAIGTGSKAFTCVETLRGFVTGQEYMVWSAANAANWMKGTFVSYAANVLTINVTATGGSGTFTDWEIGLSDFSDKPFDVEAHKDHLFLLYPKGQLQTSNLGDPMTYTTTAALFGMGDELTGFVPSKGNTATIYCRNKTELLSGSDKTTWQKSTVSLSAGARWRSTAEISAANVALDDRGLTSLQATINFGSFEMSIFSRMVQPYLSSVMDLVIGCRVLRSKSQYRLYASDGRVLICSVLTPAAQIQPNDVAFTKLEYLHNPTCAYSFEMSSEEFHAFGTDDGWIMREDVGTSFDGQAIDAVFRLPYHSFKSPSNKKRFRKVTMETTASYTTNIYFRQSFDYDNGDYEPSIQYHTTGQSGGGYYDVSEWDTFRWSMPSQGTAEANIDGVGRNMSLLIWHSSSIDPAFNIQGLIYHFTPMGLAR